MSPTTTSSNADTNSYPVANLSYAESHWQHETGTSGHSYGQTHLQPFFSPSFAAASTPDYTPSPSWMPYSPADASREPQCCLDERHADEQVAEEQYGSSGSHSTSNESDNAMVPHPKPTQQLPSDIAVETQPSVSFDPVVEEIGTVETEAPRPPLFMWTQGLRILKAKKTKKPGKKGKTTTLTVLSKPKKRSSMSKKQKNLIFGIFSSILD